jgi:hypothetical protein
MEVQLLKEALDSSHEDSFVQASHVLTTHFAEEIREALEFDQPSQVKMSQHACHVYTYCYSMHMYVFVACRVCILS